MVATRGRDHSIGMTRDFLVLISRRSDTSRSSSYSLSQIYFLLRPPIPPAKATNSEAVILLSEIMSVPYCQGHADCQVEAEAAGIKAQ